MSTNTYLARSQSELSSFVAKKIYGSKEADFLSIHFSVDSTNHYSFIQPWREHKSPLHLKTKRDYYKRGDLGPIMAIKVSMSTEFWPPALSQVLLITLKNLGYSPASVEYYWYFSWPLIGWLLYVQISHGYSWSHDILKLVWY